MIGKLPKQSLVSGCNKAKDFVGHAYSTTKHVLSNVDSGVTLFKHVYSASHPLIDQHGGNTLKEWNNGCLKRL